MRRYSGRVEELALQVLFRREPVLGAKDVEAYGLTARVDLQLEAVAARLVAAGVDRASSWRAQSRMNGALPRSSWRTTGRLSKLFEQRAGS